MTALISKKNDYIIIVKKLKKYILLISKSIF